MTSIPSATEESRGKNNVSATKVTRDTGGRKDIEGKENDAEDDLDTLRKEYRNMQANRNAFAHESDRVLRRQLATLEKLRAENETLKADVARLQTRHMTRPINTYEQSQLDRLYQELEKYTIAVEEEKTKAATMEKEILKLRDEIWNRRRQMGGVNAAAENQRQAEKKVRLLEGKLDQALVKFNKCVSRNKLLREEIDGLRAERVTFEKLHSKVEKDLSEKKKHMALIIEQSNQAYEERDRALLEIAAIERLNRKEDDAYQQQVTELNDELEAVNNQLLLHATKRGQTALVVDPKEEEKKAAQRREVARASEIALAEEEYAQQRREKLLTYENAFREISAATGISDVDELVKVFIENEDHNFSLFRYSNEQAAEIKRLEEEIHSLREEELMYKENANVRDGRMQEMVKLENEVKSMEEQTAFYESKCNSYQNLLEVIMEEIKLLLTRLDFKLDVEEGGSTITTDNIMHYLGIIEEKTSEILSKYQRMTGSTGLENRSLGIRDQGAAPPISVNPPQLLDCSSEESGDEGGGESTLKPQHRSDINYSKIATTLSKRKTISSRRRGSTMFQPRRSSLH